jgi:hypothetical protein
VLLKIKMIWLRIEIWILYAYVTILALILFCVGATFYIPACITGFFALIYLAKSSYTWLSEGYWVEHNNWEILERFNLVDSRDYLLPDWIGVSKVMDWVLSSHPIGITLALGLLVVMFNLLIELWSLGDFTALDDRREKLAALQNSSTSKSDPK